MRVGILVLLLVKVLSGMEVVCVVVVVGERIRVDVLLVTSERGVGGQAGTVILIELQRTQEGGGVLSKVVPADPPR